jgi:predicted TIM-barrel fold metal-dependent hydrolase
MGFIDVDTHVLECEATWDYLDPNERHFRPQAANLAEGVGSVAIAKSVWLVGDTWGRRWPSDGRPSGFGKEFNPGVTHLEDPAARLQDMDALGVDAQVLISTFFIGIELEHPHADAAITRSFNRWVAERVVGSHDRLRWLLVPPLSAMDRAFEELEFGAANGACGVMLKGVEHGRYLDDPYFFPFYERAQDLGLVMCVHLGKAVRDIPNLPIGNLVPTPAAFIDHVATVMKGFYAVLSSDLHLRFPRLKWAFLESGSSWVPGIFQMHHRLMSTAVAGGFVHGDFPGGTSVQITAASSAEMMREKQLYVACQTDEDLPHLAELLGDSQLVFGSDYCHNDIGADPVGHTVLLARDDLDPDTARRITDDNGRELFGIPASFRPSNVAQSVAR